jgi:mono/diheme cytochrome c family protein
MYHKNLLSVTTLMVLTITIFIACLSNDKKKTGKSDSAAAKASQPKNDTFRVRPLTNIKYEHTAERLKRGEYLATGILECFMCHTERDWKLPGAPPIAGKLGCGKILEEDSIMRLAPPNITPDKETGAGTWTDDMFARAIREGVGHDGRALSPGMPYNNFKHLSDEDLASVIVYIRSLPPVHNVVLPTKIPAGDRSGIEKSLKPITERVLDPDFSNAKKLGRYLVGLAGCADCHTSFANYSPGAYAGGILINHGHGSAFSANITSDASGMIYGPEGFIFVMRTGKGGTLSHNMPWIALKNINDDDLKAIYAYLQTIPPSRHYINNQKPFTHCVICGQEHGLGDKNKLEKPAGIKLDPNSFEQYTGTYYNKEFDFSPTVIREGNKLVFKAWENGPKAELIPQSELHFLAPGWYLPFTFIKDKNGNVTGMVEDSDEGQFYKKIK